MTSGFNRTSITESSRPESLCLMPPLGDSNAASLMAGVWEPQTSVTGLTEAERMDTFAGESI